MDTGLSCLNQYSGIHKGLRQGGSNMYMQPETHLPTMEKAAQHLFARQDAPICKTDLYLRDTYKVCTGLLEIWISYVSVEKVR